MSENGVFVFNPLPWERTVAGPVPGSILDIRGEAADQTASRHSQDRASPPYAGGEPATGAYLPETTVEGYGYATIPVEDLVSVESLPFSEQATVTTDRHELVFDRDRGGIASWYDRERDREWVDADADWPLAGFVHEEVADHDAEDARKLLYRHPPDAEDWTRQVAGVADTERGFQSDWHARRRGPTRVTRHRVYETPIGIDVRQCLEAPGVASPVNLRVVLPTVGDEAGSVIVEANWEMDSTRHPEATYLAFPFDLDDPTPRVDVGGQAIVPGRDQIEGSCHDYYTAQRWVDVSDGDRGMTVGTPINPLVTFGGFHFGADQRSVDLEDGHVYGWVTNNYWETNFRASQSGLVRARYHLRPHDGFEESEAHRAGENAAHWRPAFQTLDEPGIGGDETPLGRRGQLLDLPEPPVLALQIRPANADTHPHDTRGVASEPSDAMAVLLKNASDDPHTAAVGSADLQIQRARRDGLLGVQTDDGTIPVRDGRFEVALDPRETVRLTLGCER